MRQDAHPGSTELIPQSSLPCRPMPEQLSFAALFEQAALEHKTRHLPASMAEAAPYFRTLIERHHAAMLATDFRLAQAINDEAHDLARHLNGDDPASRRTSSPSAMFLNAGRLRRLAMFRSGDR